MRGAPVGFFFSRYPLLLREVSRMIARTTHGHPTAEAAAVVVAVLVREAMCGTEPALWADRAILALSGMRGGEMVDALNSVAGAVLAPSDEAALRSLGEGWVSEEAVAMALASVLRHPDEFEAAVRCAVNHDGDSDTVGCIAGAIAGARLGEEALPRRWIEHLDEAREIVDLADRLVAARERLR